MSHDSEASAMSEFFDDDDDCECEYPFAMGGDYDPGYTCRTCREEEGSSSLSQPYVRIKEDRDQGGDREQPNRWRCLITGCNPVLHGEEAAQAHKEAFGHRVAKWPVRSAEGKAKARQRNKSGYYDKYNVGYKSARYRF